MGLLEKSFKKEDNNWYSINIKTSQIKKKVFIEKFKEFFGIEDETITRSDSLFQYLRKLLEYNPTIIILNFLYNIETFRESFEISQKRVNDYLNFVEKILKDFAEKNEGQSVKNLHFKELNKRYVKKLGLEIISIF